MFENSYRNVAISRSDVEFVRCVFNNAAEANVSLKTTTGNNSTLTFKDSVIANSNVAGIMNWCDEIVEESSYCTINILNTKFYCWKSSDNARVMVESGNGDFYKTVNSVFQAVINNGNAKKILSNATENIIFRRRFSCFAQKAAGKTRRNSTGFTKTTCKNHSSRNSIVSAFLSVANVYGYADASFIAPDENRNIVIDAKICAFLMSLSKQPLKTCGKIKNIIYLHLLKFTRCLN